MAAKVEPRRAGGGVQEPEEEVMGCAGVMGERVLKRHGIHQPEVRRMGDGRDYLRRRRARTRERRGVCVCEHLEKCPF